MWLVSLGHWHHVLWECGIDLCLMGLVGTELRSWISTAVEPVPSAISLLALKRLQRSCWLRVCLALLEGPLCCGAAVDTLRGLHLQKPSCSIF